jgi:hypothetical protein
MAQERHVLQWQRRMATFMTASIVTAAVFFAVITIWQFVRFGDSARSGALATVDLFEQLTIPPKTFQEELALTQARAAYALERELVSRRYGQANLTLTTRVWTRLMGFITGMILSLVGAAFILGKLSEDVSEATAKAGAPGQELMVSVRSASPGIILVIMGTVLMALSISIQATYEVEDRAIYFGRAGQSITPASDADIAGPEDPASLLERLKRPAAHDNNQFDAAGKKGQP